MRCDCANAVWRCLLPRKQFFRVRKFAAATLAAPGWPRSSNSRYANGRSRQAYRHASGRVRSAANALIYHCPAELPSRERHWTQNCSARQRDAGASVMMPCLATIDSLDQNRVMATLHLDAQVEQRELAAVVVASGLNASGLSSVGSRPILPWKEHPHGPFGVSFMASSETIQQGVIYMACDTDGYVGLARLEDGRVDLAAALASGTVAASKRSPAQRVEEILARSELGDLALEDRSTLMTTPPLRRTRTAGVGRVLAIGDAAGFVEPFTGEGMTWAMQSGMEAANMIATSIDDLSTIGDAWNRRLAGLLRRKKFTCRIVTAALRSSVARRAVGQTLASWPSLATPLIRSLNRG